MRTQIFLFFRFVYMNCFEQLIFGDLGIFGDLVEYSAYLACYSHEHCVQIRKKTSNTVPWVSPNAPSVTTLP